eukprot:gene19403-6634_t
MTKSTAYCVSMASRSLIHKCNEANVMPCVYTYLVLSISLLLAVRQNGRSDHRAHCGPNLIEVKLDQVGQVEHADSPFGQGAYVLSVGFMILMGVCIPLGLVNLDDNISVQ